MKKLAALGLVSGAALFMISTQPADVQASKAEQKTDGKVNFKLDVPTQPPVGPGPVVPPGPGPSGTEDLRIVYAMNFDFGTQKYDSTSPKTIYAAKGTFKQVALDPDGNVIMEKDPSGNDVPQIANTFEGPLGISISNSSKVKQWKLSVKADAFKQVDDTGAFVAGGKVLDNGMSMTLKNVFSNTIVGSEATPSAKDIPLTTGESQEVGTYKHTSDSMTSLNNFVFGGEGYDKPTDPSEVPVLPAEGYKGVALYLPKGMDIQSNEAYLSTLTWTLEDTE